MSTAARSDREVLVTGVGMHTAFGGGLATLAALREARSALRSHRPGEAEGFPAVAVAAAPAPDADGLPVDRKLMKYASPASALAVLAAGRALRDAGLLDDAGRRAGLALYSATGHIGFDLGQVTRAMPEAGAGERGLGGEALALGLSRCHPLLPFQMLLNMPLGLVSIAFGIKGENAVLYPGPLQGGVAMAMGYQAVARGRCRAALVGASHHGTALLPLALARRQGRVASGPGAALRREEGGGWGAADAAAFLLLEDAGAAQERGARPRARLVAARGQLADGAADRALAWRELYAGGPGLALTSGAEDGPAEAEDRALAAEAGLQAGALWLLDHAIGHAGAAAPAAAAGLAALALGEAASGVERAAVLVRDPDGGLALAALARPALPVEAGLR